MSEKISVIATITAKHGKEKDAEDILKGMVSPTRSEAGCERYDLYRVKSPEGAFVLFEIYKDQAALEAHRATAHYQAYRARIADCLGEPIKVQLLQAVDLA